MAGLGGRPNAFTGASSPRLTQEPADLLACAIKRYEVGAPHVTLPVGSVAGMAENCVIARLGEFKGFEPSVISITMYSISPQGIVVPGVGTNFAKGISSVNGVLDAGRLQAS
jgi:hypothetical protein